MTDCNDQKRGGRTLVRALLDRLPDAPVDDPALAWPPLGHASHDEHYGVVKPIANVAVGGSV